MGLSDLICRPGISPPPAPVPIDSNPLRPVERMTIVEAMNALEAGTVEAPPSADLLGETSDAPLPPRPAPAPQRPAWQIAIDEQTAAMREQEASDRQEMKALLLARRQSVEAAARSSNDVSIAARDAQQRSEKVKRLDQQLAELNGANDGE